MNFAALSRPAGLFHATALAAAISALEVNTPADGLDCEYFANLFSLALADARAAVAGSWLGPVAGVRICCRCRGDRDISPYDPAARASRAG